HSSNFSRFGPSQSKSGVGQESNSGSREGEMRSVPKRRLLAVLAALSTIVATFTSSAAGQATATGVLLQGTVQDVTHASIPGATVRITDDATQVSERGTTDQAGRYVFNNLRPASYTMTVEAKGFKTLARPNVVLRVGQQTTLDLTLEVGSVTTMVE